MLVFGIGLKANLLAMALGMSSLGFALMALTRLQFDLI